MLEWNQQLQLPVADRAPLKATDRESRREQFGMRGLSDAELVAAALGPGGSVSAIQAARHLMERYGQVTALDGVPAVVLAGIPGVGPARARRLQAALELGMRALGPVTRSGMMVRGPADLHPMLRDSFRGLDRERFLALYLDTRHRVQSTETVSVGSLNASLVHPREVFKTAVGMSAAALIVAHNHPSGCPQPSADDLELTSRLAKCGDLLGIKLLDHLVVGDGEIVSIREYGWPQPQG